MWYDGSEPDYGCRALNSRRVLTLRVHNGLEFRFYYPT